MGINMQLTIFNCVYFKLYMESERGGETKPCKISCNIGIDLFYGIWIIVGYLMPNPVYPYILDIYNLST